MILQTLTVLPLLSCQSWRGFPLATLPFTSHLSSLSLIVLSGNRTRLLDFVHFLHTTLWTGCSVQIVLNVFHLWPIFLNARGWIGNCWRLALYPYSDWLTVTIAAFRSLLMSVILDIVLTRTLMLLTSRLPKPFIKVLRHQKHMFRCIQSAKLKCYLLY